MLGTPFWVLGDPSTADSIYFIFGPDFSCDQFLNLNEDSLSNKVHIEFPIFVGTDEICQKYHDHISSPQFPYLDFAEELISFLFPYKLLFLNHMGKKNLKNFSQKFSATELRFHPRLCVSLYSTCQEGQVLNEKDLQKFFGMCKQCVDESNGPDFDSIPVFGETNNMIPKAVPECIRILTFLEARCVAPQITGIQI